jgi:hypothetical protein
VRNAFDAGSIRGQVGGGWALEIETFLGPVKWHRADRRVPFWAPKSRDIEILNEQNSHISNQILDLRVLWILNMLT